MKLFSVFAASVAPGAALLTYIYLKDYYQTEPLKPVLRLFLFGVLILFPTMVIQRGLMLGLGDHDLVFAFVISAGIEEFVKWFILFFVMYKHEHFDEPYDGIVYAVAVSIGFASLENFIYIWNYPVSLTDILMRALLPVSAHALFAVVMGYYLGKAKFADSSSRAVKFIWLSLLIPIGWHGSFNYIQVITDNWLAFIIPFMVLLWCLGLRKMNRANAASPFRLEHQQSRPFD